MTGRPVDAQRRRERQDSFLAAFARTGILKMAAEEVGIYASQHHYWVETDPEYAERFDRVKAEAEAAGLADANRLPRARNGNYGGERGAAKLRNQEKFLEVLARTGILADAAAEAGVVIATYHYWRRSDPEFARRAEDAVNATERQRAETMSARRSRGSTAAWDNPERREEWAQRQREEFWTPERRAEQAQRMTEAAATPEGRQVRVDAGKLQWTPEKRQLRSEEMLGKWADPEYRESMAEPMAAMNQAAVQTFRARWARMTPEERDAHVKRMRTGFKGGHWLTKIEAAVLVALNDRDIPYFTHKYVSGYVADVLVPSLSLIIECDGEYYHSRRNGHDEARDAAMAELGYETLRLPEAVIKAKDWVRLDETIARLSRTSA